MEAKNIKTVSDLIEFFEPIPEDKWCIHLLENSKGQRCALGHLNYALVGTPHASTGNRLFKAISGKTDWDLADANNSDKMDPKRGTLNYLKSLVN